MKKRVISLAVRAMLRPDHGDVFMAYAPDRVSAVWEPLEAIIDRIATTGTVDVMRGTVVFNEGDGWYDCVQALRDLLDFYELAKVRYGVDATTAPLYQFANKLDSGSPLFEPDIARVRCAIADCKIRSMSLRLSEVTDMLETLSIRRELQRLGVAA